MLTCKPESALSLHDLPAEVQAEVYEKRALFVAVRDSGMPYSPQLLAACEPGREGWSAGALRNSYQAWIKSGCDALSLVDKRHFPNLWQALKTTVLPEEFVLWAGGQMLANQRASSQGYRDVLRRWKLWRKTGDAKHRIPGYEVCPPDCGKGHPAGWSKANLRKLAQSTKAERAIARIGTVAAKPHLPYIPGTRKGVRWLEYIFFDDVVHDRKCLVPGYPNPVRILQLGALDYATGVYLKFGIRPDLPRDDGSRERLKRRDMLCLVAGLLMEYGMPAEYPMHLVCERATATMNAAEAKYLWDLSNGQIRVGYTSMEGQFVLAWDEQKSGNPQGKGPLESWHSLFHTYQASLPGQVGKDRDHQPATLMHSDREAAALTRTGMLLSREAQSRLQLPYPTLRQAHEQTLDIVEAINNRRDHQIEGFETALEWRLRDVPAMEWRHESELELLKEELLARVEYRPVTVSPVERMHKLAANTKVTALPPGALVAFYRLSHSAATVQRSWIKLKIEGRQYIFGPETPEEMTVADGEKVTAHHEPMDPQYAIISNARGICIGVWRRRIVRRGDEAALAAETRRKKSFVNHAVSSVRRKLADQIAAEERRTNANLEVLAEADMLSAENLAALTNGKGVCETSFATGMQTALTDLATEKERAAINARKVKARVRRDGEQAAEDLLSLSPAVAGVEPTINSVEEALDLLS